MSLNGTEKLAELNRRKQLSATRISELRSRLTRSSDLAAGCACIYATGSYGRREASEFSDLDLFIVGLMEEDKKSKRRSRLRRLDEIIIKADLISTTRALEIPDFDGDGEYLAHYAIDDITKTLGTRNDDALNSFTARLLLLLESSVLIGDDVYEEIISLVIAEYWRDYQNNRDEFIPAFLVNDILRLWRTLCVNYEAKQSLDGDELKRKSKRKIKNFKLKHSRLLTCYSTILYLAIIFGRKNTVSPEDAENMVRLTPIERIEWAMSQSETDKVKEKLSSLLRLYNRFLVLTNFSERQLEERFLDHEQEKIYSDEASAFGNKMAEILSEIGNGNALYRVLIV